MEPDAEMLEFIRETLRSNERIRDKGNPQLLQQSVTSKTSISFDAGSTELSIPATSEGYILGGGSDDFPFKITVKNSTFGSGVQPSYKVAYNSSIIDGTNGGPFIFSNLNEDIPFTSEDFKFIIAEAAVTSDPFAIKTGPAEGEDPPPEGEEGAFTIKAVDEGETDEVVITNGKQTKLRLLIGKITVEVTDNGHKLTAWQAVTTSFRTAVSFHNGVPVYILQVAPTHQSRI